MQKSTYILYTDGSCLKNPGGSGGYGAILINISTGELAGKSEGFFSTTNNRMEVMAAIEGLDIVPRGAEVELVSDSQYLVKTLQGAFAKKKNHDLWAALDQVMAGKSVNVRWVRGHASDPYNNQCDQMAVQAAYSPAREDTGYQDRIPAPGGEACYTGAERKVRQSCLNAIEEVNRKAEPRFKDFADLKTGGLDGWSSLVDPRELVGQDTVRALEALLPSGKDVAACIRWYGRGLKFRHCIRKVLVDAEIRENAAKGKCGNVFNTAK